MGAYSGLSRHPGDEQIDVSKAMMDRVAAAWTRQPITAATIAPVGEVDQWTIQSALRNLRPLSKFFLHLTDRFGRI